MTFAELKPTYLQAKAILDYDASSTEEKLFATSVIKLVRIALGSHMFNMTTANIDATLNYWRQS